MIVSSKWCSASHLSRVLILVGCFLLLSTSVLAQAYLYDYSYIGAGIGPLGAVLADFNGDGRSDFATVDYDDGVSVILGKSNWAFASPVNYSTGEFPFALIAAHLRGKGSTDLITLNMPNGVDEPGTVSVLLGNDDGTFQANVDYFVGDFPVGLVAGDFNDDGKTDLAIANKTDNTISILYGNGDGSFQPQVLVDVGSEPTSIAAGDFNGDGKSDLIASCVRSGVVSVLLNAGAGKFTRVDTPSGLFDRDTSLIVTGKFTVDGKLDTAISSSTMGQIYLLKGQGDGSFLPPISVGAAAGEVYSLIAADIDHDGKTDLGYESLGPQFSVLFGQGSGKFSTPVVSPIAAIGSVILADLNGDGFLDLVTPELSSSIAIVLGNGKGQFGWPRTGNISGTPYGPNTTVVADFNGDGKLDLAIAETNFPTAQVAVTFGTGQGSFGPAIISPLLSQAINNQNYMLSGDFNGDGAPDLIIMDDYSTGFQVLLSKRDGTFQPPVDTKLNTNLSFVVGDFNGDGKTDLEVSSQGLISIYLSNGDGTFKVGAQYATLNSAPVVADVNRDGNPDLVFVGNPTFVMLGNGNGTFQNAITGPVVLIQAQATVNDFDGDGTPDIVVATYSGIAFLKGNGDGTFQNPVYSVFASLFGGEFQAEDVNGDGKLDLVSTGVFVFLGNGDGTFRSPFYYGANGQIYRGNVVAGDFNSDGIGDVAIIFQDRTSARTAVSLYLSQPTVAILPTAINFGSIAVGLHSHPIYVHVANEGNENLLISSVQVSANFVESNNCGSKLGIGKTCTIKVEFEPNISGTLTGTVKIKDNALGTIQQISLSGVGK